MNRARTGRQLPRDQVEVSRFACPVGADDGRERAGRKATLNRIHGHMTAEPHSQVLGFEHEINLKNNKHRHRVQSVAIQGIATPMKRTRSALVADRHVRFLGVTLAYGVSLGQC